MNAQKVAGLTAAISGAALLVLGVVASLAGPAFSVGTTQGPTWSAPAQGLFGPGMMGGYGMGPGMMGSGHMGGYGYGTQGGATPIAGAPTVTVTASDLRFSPTEITLPSREVNLTLTNSGQVLHDLTVPGLGIRVVVRPGESQTVGLRDLPTGRYAGYCSVAGHAEAGMRIAVVIQ